MSIIAEPNCCPKCGAPIPPEAPAGLCPKCLLAQAALPTEAGPRAASKSAPPTQAELARAFPQLEILELIGQGGMGFVFKARQRKLQRLVALKILPASLAADPAFAERFTREGRLLAQLSHPNIVTIHDFGQADGFFYLLMEFVDGVNLRQAMKIGRFTPAQALAIVPKICEALQFAHNEGILHRDIKPENILLDAKGRVKIADFGIAKLMGDPFGSTSDPLAPSGGEGRGEGAAPALTATGKILGTPHYMAPEQLEKPQEVDHRADIYSLGVVFYEMLTGELPLGRFAAPSEKSAADPRLDEVVFRALEKEPSRRTQTAGEVKTQVETISGHPPTASNPQPQPVGGQAPGRISLNVLLAAALTMVSFISLVWAMVLELKPAGTLALVVPPALFGTVLGILELSYVRHGGARARGTGLAIAASVTWPLLLVDVLLVGILVTFLQTAFNYPSDLFQQVAFIFGSVTALALDAIVLRYVVDWTRRSPLQFPDRRTASRLSAGAALWVVLFVVALEWASTRPPRPAWQAGLDLTPPYRSPLRQSPRNAAAEAVIQTLTVPADNLSPGLQIFRWKYSVPPGDVLVFRFIPYSNNVPAAMETPGLRVPPGIENGAYSQDLFAISEAMSGWRAAGPDNAISGTFQWSVQAGEMLSPELKDRERWDAKLLFVDRRGSGSVGRSLWIQKLATTSTGLMLTGDAHRLQTGQSKALRVYTTHIPGRSGPTNLFLQVSLYALPKDFLLGPGGEGTLGSTDWQGFFARRMNQSITNDSHGNKPQSEQPVSASAELWSPPLLRGEKPDPQKILVEMQALTAAGRYEESLQMHVWYHNHALEYNPDQRGVRLSFALADWIELGRSYPKAKTALLEIRDRTTALFDEDRGNFARFQEVASINSYLQNDDPTLELFDKIEKQDKALAKQCFFQVRSLLVKHGMYARYLQYQGDPQKAFDDMRAKRERMRPVLLLDLADRSFIDETCQLIEVLVGTAQKPQAEKIRDQAVAVLDDARLKSAVSDAEKKINK